MKHRHAILLIALVPSILVLGIYALSSFIVIPLMNADNETFTVWGWVNGISNDAWLFLTPIALLAYFGYPLASKNEGLPITKRLVVFVVAEVIVYVMFYYFWFGGRVYSYYQGGYIQDGTYLYHWWFTGPLASYHFLAFVIWYIWPAVVIVAAGFARTTIRQ